MRRITAVTLLLSLILSLAAMGSQTPTILQPDDPAYSAAERGALLGAVSQLESLLSASFPVARSRLSGLGWTEQDFAAFTAGKIEQGGYTAVLVRGTDATGAPSVWIAVGVALGSRTGWIPVEPMPNDRSNEWQLGFVPTLIRGSAVQFDSNYLTYGTVIELPVNLSPVAGIRRPLTVLVAGEKETIYGYGSADPDGQIILYQWRIDDEDPIETSNWSLRHTFEEVGEFTITLTVIDNRGATASTSIVVEVLEEDPGCGCGD